MDQLSGLVSGWNINSRITLLNFHIKCQLFALESRGSATGLRELSFTVQ